MAPLALNSVGRRPAQGHAAHVAVMSAPAYLARYGPAGNAHADRLPRLLGARLGFAGRAQAGLTGLAWRI